MQKWMIYHLFYQLNNASLWLGIGPEHMDVLVA